MSQKEAGIDTWDADGNVILTFSGLPCSYLPLPMGACISCLAFLKDFWLFAVDDGCLENSPDTAEFSREFQLHQHLFDPEHDYPGLGKWVSSTLITTNHSYYLYNVLKFAEYFLYIISAEPQSKPVE